MEGSSTGLPENLPVFSHGRPCSRPSMRYIPFAQALHGDSGLEEIGEVYYPPVPPALTLTSWLNLDHPVKPDISLPMFRFSYLESVVVPGQVVPLSIPGGEDAASWFKAALQRDSEWASFVVLALEQHPPDGCLARVLRLTEDGQEALIQGVCTCKWSGSGWLEELANGEEVVRPGGCVIEPPAAEGCQLALEDLDSIAVCVPQVTEAVSSLEEGKWWLLARAPLPLRERVEYLSLGASDAITKLMSLKREWPLVCRNCNAKVGFGKDAVQLVDLGPTLVCINPNKFVQSFICMAAVAPAVFHSQMAESEASWFPGYLWSGAFCRCQYHLGWKFTAVEAGLPVEQFWGLKDVALQMDSPWGHSLLAPFSVSDETTSEVGSLFSNESIDGQMVVQYEGGSDMEFSESEAEAMLDQFH